MFRVTPRVRALVKIERIKRNSAPGRALWNRARAVRERLCRDISEAEWRAFVELDTAARHREKLRR